MTTDNTDLNKSATEVPPKDLKTELTDEELAKVTGGKLYEAACKGTHIPNVVIEFI